MSSEPPAPFDPRSVPGRPVVEVTFEVAPDGRTLPRLDGLPVRTRGGETPREAAVRAVAGFVDRIASPDETGMRSAGVYARIHGPQRSVRLVVIHRDGRVFMPAGPQVTPTGAPLDPPHDRIQWSLGRDDDEGMSAGPADPPPPTPEDEPEPDAEPAPEPQASERRNPPLAHPRANHPLPAWLRPREESNRRWPGAGEVSGHAPLKRARRGPDEPAGADTGAGSDDIAPGDAAPATDLPRPADADDGPDVLASPPAWSATFLDAAPVDKHLTESTADASAAWRPPAPTPTSPSGAARPAGPRLAPVADLVSLHAGRRASAPRPAADLGPGQGPRAVFPEGFLREGPRRVRLRPVGVALAAVALVVAGAGGLLTHSLTATPDPSQSASVAPAAPAPAEPTTTPRLPVAAPDGYLPEARWASPALLREAGAVVPTTSGIAYVAADRTLHVVDAMTGTDRWTTALPAGAITGPPAATAIDGRPVLALQVGQALTWWNPETGGTPASVPLPAGARVTYLGGAPLIGLDARTVGIVRGGRLERVAVPGGAAPLAARTDGTVTATSPAGWWHLRPGVTPPAATAWESDDPDPRAPAPAPSVVGYLGSTIVAVGAPDRSRRRHIVAYHDGADRVRVSFRAGLADEAAAANPDGFTWHPSPAGTWGVLGRTLVDVAAGRVVDLGAWRTTWVAQERAYGRLGAQNVVVGPHLPRGVLGADATVAEVQVPAGAAVRVHHGGTEVIYLVPPRQ